METKNEETKLKKEEYTFSKEIDIGGVQLQYVDSHLLLTVGTEDAVYSSVVSADDFENTVIRAAIKAVPTLLHEMLEHTDSYYLTTDDCLYVQLSLAVGSKTYEEVLQVSKGHSVSLKDQIKTLKEKIEKLQSRPCVFQNSFNIPDLINTRYTTFHEKFMSRPEYVTLFRQFKTIDHVPLWCGSRNSYISYLSDETYSFGIDHKLYKREEGPVANVDATISDLNKKMAVRIYVTEHMDPRTCCLELLSYLYNIVNIVAYQPVKNQYTLASPYKVEKKETERVELNYVIQYDCRKPDPKKFTVDKTNVSKAVPLDPHYRLLEEVAEFTATELIDDVPHVYVSFQK